MSRSCRESGGRLEGLDPEAKWRERPPPLLERRTCSRQTTIVTKIIRAKSAVTQPMRRKIFYRQENQKKYVEKEFLRTDNCKYCRV